jgi:MarR family transcriptional regulator, organic hydroperoxide resistance regulator
VPSAADQSRPRTRKSGGVRAPAAAATGDSDPSPYARAIPAVNADHANGERTLEATEQAVAGRLSGMEINMSAMAAVSNIYRAANAVRNHVESTVLAPHDLTWTGWVVLWVVWIWGDIESRHVAAEAGISKGTLTGVASTLIARGLVTRRVHPDDARRVLLALTPTGTELMTTLFPEFNRVEARVTSQLDDAEVLALARLLRSVVKEATQD